MSVEAAQAGVRQAEMKLVEAQFLLEKEMLVAESPDADLAVAIRNEFYGGRAPRLLVDSAKPERWLRMAAAARSFLTASENPEGARVLRVFNKGDWIPADVTEVSNESGMTAVRGGYGGWWWVEDDEGRAAAARREGWSEDYFHGHPLTEVIADAPAKREPRVFKAGDPEPEDRDTIVLRRQEAGGRRLELRYGKYGVRAASELTEWWQVAQDHPTFGKWDYWLAHFGPLVEVVDGEDVRERRVFSSGDSAPADLKRFKDRDGDVFYRDGGEWTCDRLEYTDGFDFLAGEYGPLTEVFE